MLDKFDEGFGYQKTDLGLLPVEWVVVPIGKVITLSQYGLSVAADEKGTVPILGMKDLSNGRVRLDDLARVCINQKEIEQFCLKPGDILLNRTNSYDLVGKVGLYNSNQTVIFASYLVRFQFDITKALPEFINYVLNSHSAQQGLKRLATKGVSQANINPTVFRNQFLVPLPPLREQKGIVDILQAWDEAIAKTEKLITAKQKRKIVLLQQILKSNSFLSGFKVCTLGEIANISMGQSPSSENYNDKGIGVPLIQGNADIENMRFVPRIWTTQVTKTVTAGEIIMTVRAPVGEVAITDFNACIGRGVCSLLPQPGISKKFLYFLMIGLKKQWARLSQGSTFTAVNSKDIKNLYIKYPLDKSVQESVGNLGLALEKEESLLNQQLQKLQKQKRGLMQKLLTGKWRVTVEETD